MNFRTISQSKPLLTLGLFFMVSVFNPGYSQQKESQLTNTQHKLKSVMGQANDLFGRQGRYIENKGQYCDTVPGLGYMGPVLYGYEGLPMPVFFTAKGVIHTQRKERYLSYEERVDLYKRGVTKEERKKMIAPVDRNIIFEWVNANPNPEIIASEMVQGYHTYGLQSQKAYAYKKIVYKNIYPGIDAEYSFIDSDKPGYEYSLVINANADVSKIKVKIGGDVKSVFVDQAGKLVVQSAVEDIVQSLPLCYLISGNSKSQKQKAGYTISDNVFRFNLPAGFTAGKSFVIDPFVSNTSSLTGSGSGKAKDIDFDYAGNIFVSGGGDGTAQMLAKYSPAGVLLWTFSGSLTTPAWSFGASYGGWVVEKSSGAVYMGQGLAAGGFAVIRLNAAGFFDNYITTQNSNFAENWKMIYSCNGGTPAILIAGGGGNANNELAVLNSATTIPVTSNLTGLGGGHNDISDIVIDPVNNEMYTIYSTPVTDAIRDNLLFRHAPPYNAGTRIWQSNTGGLLALREPNNRPYMNGLDNSSNTLAVNSTYLFYWDGRNLKAYSKATGTQVGTPAVFATNTLLQQGGVYADECNNVFIGFNNGTIKVLQFDGVVFNDAAATDISIAPYTGSVFDIVYDNGQQLLYVCGNGFVASVDISAYCPATIYDIVMVENCAAGSIQASLNPVPLTGTTILYELYQGTTLLGSNSTGFFNGLLIGESYTIKVFLNIQCGGTHSQENFIFYNSNLLVVNNPPAICPDGFTDLTLPAVTAGTAPGFTFSYWNNIAVTSPLTNPAAVPPGTYYIKATPAAGCYTLKKVVVDMLPTPVPDAGRDAVICYGKDIQLNGSNGVNYVWSPSTGLDNPRIPNPTLINPLPGTYTYALALIDANGCRSAVFDTVVVKVNPPLPIGLVRDTLVAINQQLQLNAVDVMNSGFVSYTWTPAFGLNNPLIADPVAVLDRDMSYQVLALTADDCFGSATINVKVHLGPEIYVPSAFTPDGDGLNDIIRPVVVGMREFHYFKIFNRWGQLVFSSANPSAGWNGKISGVEQLTNTFVWIAEAVDFNGKLVKRKGTITLIR